MIIPTVLLGNNIVQVTLHASPACRGQFFLSFLDNLGLSLQLERVLPPGERENPLLYWKTCASFVRNTSVVVVRIGKNHALSAWEWCEGRIKRLAWSYTIDGCHGKEGMKR